MSTDISKSNLLIAGSLKTKVVASDLLEERKNLDFDQKELSYLFFGSKEVYEDWHIKVSQIINDPVLRKEADWYEKNRELQLVRNIQRVRRLYEIDKKRWFLDNENDYYSWVWYIYKGAVSN